MINFLYKMKLNKFAYLQSKLLGNHTLKIMKKYLKFTKKIWKNHGNTMEFCQSEKVGIFKMGPMLFYEAVWT